MCPPLKWNLVAELWERREHFQRILLAVAQV
jgi:hypothetical protein